MQVGTKALSKANPGYDQQFIGSGLTCSNRLVVNVCKNHNIWSLQGTIYLLLTTKCTVTLAVGVPPSNCCLQMEYK